MKLLHPSFRDKFLAEPLPSRLHQLSEDLLRIQEGCDHQTVSAVMEAMLLEAEYHCEWTVADAAPAMQTMLADLQMRLAMWRRVYPRLGKQPAFRAAVAREAASWVKRLTDSHVSL